MKNSKWLKVVKSVMVFLISTEIVVKHVINWRVNDNLLNKYKNIYPYLYKSKSMANQFMYNQVFFESVVDEASEKSKKMLYKINPHKYWQMKP